jgi:hypothetical protein
VREARGRADDACRVIALAYAGARDRRTKEAAPRACAPLPEVGGSRARAPVWRNVETMLAWLASL